MWTARSLRVASRYALPPLLGGIGLAPAGRRRAAAAALTAAVGVMLFFRDPQRLPRPGQPGLVYSATVVLILDCVAVPWLPGGPLPAAQRVPLTGRRARSEGSGIGGR